MRRHRLSRRVFLVGVALFSPLCVVQRPAFFGLRSKLGWGRLRGQDSPSRAVLADELVLDKATDSTRSPELAELWHVVDKANLGEVPEWLLHRCYGACKQRVPQAFSQVRDIIRWREREQVDSILSNAVALEHERWYRKVLHYGLPGRDKSGRAVMIEAVGMWDMEALDKAAQERRADMLRSHIVCCEMLSAQAHSSAAAGTASEEVPGFVAVLDMKDISLRQNPMSFPEVLNALRDISKINSRYYPEAMEHVFVVNAPSVFKTIWNIVAPFVLPASGAKVDVLKEGDFGALVRECGPACLPAQLGGNLPSDTAPYGR